MTSATTYFLSKIEIFREIEFLLSIVPTSTINLKNISVYLLTFFLKLGAAEYFQKL